ncbi:hypothetical protein TGME49_232110 [Toxoplasma gondii ME49]|uniref:Uncharacterized protein n=3 Tax=Toxoplasma gondii TaxID=5811 RepID=A0A125YI97_TOXGV|nr:hypothetical protein TGME49_232110 [Toxoplasma gondii ME49]EPT28885.1 hypothetical protein TGME49_232110 [Toxoplasma gondii ME49]ESS35764.1 hypothetical protein TGVEG_232110 [Toxoplasma gondii VEG]KYF46177.1 hypothetical protein TGARI_232110 [Toxoplasma gondii ARI]|eukprot:XP_018636824.1 hypothetical protein TGME49_232110 [Toxoplasma gondii ME49]
MDCCVTCTQTRCADGKAANRAGSFAHLFANPGEIDDTSVTSLTVLGVHFSEDTREHNISAAPMILTIGLGTHRSRSASNQTLQFIYGPDPACGQAPCLPPKLCLHTPSHVGEEGTLRSMARRASTNTQVSEAFQKRDFLVNLCFEGELLLSALSRRRSVLRNSFSKKVSPFPLQRETFSIR